MPSETVKDMANATVGVFRKLEINSNINVKIQVKARRNEKEKLYYGNYRLLVLFLFTDGLHDDCSSSGVDVGFHENQGLPSAKNCLTVYDRQGFVWAQKH